MRGPEGPSPEAVERTPLITIIGVGTPHRGDDAVGAVVAAALADRLVDVPGVRVVELDGEPVRLIQAWEGSDAVILIDAVRSGSEPGIVHRLGSDEIRSRPVGDRGPTSGHALGLGEAFDLAAVLDRLPERIEVYAVEAATFDLGAPMSPIVAEACASLVESLVERVDALRDMDHHPLGGRNS